jgi:hypothetical protein
MTPFTGDLPHAPFLVHFACLFFIASKRPLAALTNARNPGFHPSATRAESKKMPPAEQAAIGDCLMLLL